VTRALKPVSFDFFGILFVLLLPPAFGLSEDIPKYNSTLKQTGFIENKGQIIDQNNTPNPAILYLLNLPGMNVQLRKSGFSYDVYAPKSPEGDLFRCAGVPLNPLKGTYSAAQYNQFPEGNFSAFRRPGGRIFHRIDFNLLGSNPHCQIISYEPYAGHLNYYRNGTPGVEITNIRSFQRISYKNIYPHIDLEFLTDQGFEWKYNFIIHPGGNINQIRIRISEPEQISLYADSLIIHTNAGEIKEYIPESFYQNGGMRIEVSTGFRKISDDVFGFSTLQSFPEESTLVIDPTCIRLWGTYYGGTDWESGEVVVTDTIHNVFLTGVTQSLENIATAWAYQTVYFQNWWSGFIAKFNANGIRQWGTYYQGSVNGFEQILSSALDISGNIIIAGITSSDTGLATSGAHQTTFGGGNYDGFVAKFNTQGQRLWATYYGGEDEDDISGVTTDSYGNIYVSGYTNSFFNIATPGSYQPSHYPNGSNEAFLVKLDSSGIRQWGTYYGGEDSDVFTTCSADTSDNILITGYTSSSVNMASPGAYQTMLAGGIDALLVAFTPDGQRLWGTYYGGAQIDRGYGCTADSNGFIYIVGRTNSDTGIASPGCHQPVWGGDDDGFIAKFNYSGQRIWGSYYGGSDYDNMTSCAISGNGDIFFTGLTSSPDNIATQNSFMPGFKGAVDACLIKFNAGGQRQWGTYFGDVGNDQGWSCSYVHDDTVYLAGRTYSSSNITTPNGHQPIFGGGSDAYLIKFLECWPIDPAGPITGTDSVCQGTFGVVYSIQPLAHAVNYSWTLPPGAAISGPGNTTSITVNYGLNAASGEIWVKGLNKCGDPGDSSFLYVTAHVPPVPVINGNDTVCRLTSSVYKTQSGKSNYLWAVSPGGTITSGGTPGCDSVTILWNSTGNQWLTVSYTDTNGCAALNPSQKDIWVNQEGPTITTSPLSKTICSGDSTRIILTSAPPATTFIWAAAGSGPLITGYFSGSGNTINQQLFNTDTIPGTVTYTITPLGEECPGMPEDYVVTVNPNLLIIITISASDNPTCEGTSDTFTAAPTNGGTSPIYQWKVNGINAGINNAIFTYIPAQGDTVTCTLASSEPCTSNNPASSNPIIMIVIPALPVSVSIIASENPFCLGNPVTFTAISINGGTNPDYQWKVNGINAGTNNAVFTFNPADGDSVFCIMTSNLTCVSGNPATSNVIVLDGSLAPLVSFTPCFDTITTTNAKPIRLKGGIPFGGTYSGAGVSNGYFYPNLAGTGATTITYTYTNFALCSASAQSLIHSFTQSLIPCGQPITDIRDGKTYQTVQIGSQCWFAENLDYGTLVPSAQYQRDNCIPEKYVRSAFSVQGSALYQWDELMQYTDIPGEKGLCPPGWHVPTEAEWITLFANWTNNAFAGAPLKYSGYSGFNAFLIGTAFFNKGWYFEDFATFFWSSTSHGPDKAWSHAMNDYNYSVSSYPSYRSNAFSVRCLRDYRRIR
jgi:uncharacterized protein (TIGR02145 family)